MRQVMRHRLPHLRAHTRVRANQKRYRTTRVITFGSGCAEFVGHADKLVRPRPNERVPGTLDDDQLRISDFEGQSVDFWGGCR